MDYIENSFFFNERYHDELEKIKILEESYKLQFKKPLQKRRAFSTDFGIEKTINDKKESLFLHFLMFKVIEELFYKDEAAWTSLQLHQGLSLKMTIYDDKVIFNNVMRVTGFYASYPDFWFRKESLLEDLVYFAKAILPECDARKKFINNIHSDFAFIEKIKIEEKIESLITTDNEKKIKRI